jgi:hypothetical protein
MIKKTSGPHACFKKPIIIGEVRYGLKTKEKKGVDFLLVLYQLEYEKSSCTAATRS